MKQRNIVCPRCGKTLIITGYEDKLAEELRREGIQVQQQKCVEYNYGMNKHIDIVILSHKLNIEVDGSLHRTNRKQRKSDFWRDKSSAKKGFETIRVTNGDIDYDIDDVIEFIEECMKDIEDEEEFR